MQRNFLVGMLVALVLLVAGVLVWFRQRRAGRALYHERLLDAVADGVITQEELAELDALRRKHDLSSTEARVAALVAYRRVLAEALEDAELTPDEDRTLERLQEQLGLDERELRADRTQLCRARLLTRVVNGELPHAEIPGIQLVPGEQGHWFVRATFAERTGIERGARTLRALEFDVDADVAFSPLGERDALGPRAEILPSDVGVLAITSRRVVFQGARRTISLPHARLALVALHSDGVRLDEAPSNHADPQAVRTARFFLVDDPELTAAVALYSARQRRGEIRPATRPPRTA